MTKEELITAAEQLYGKDRFDFSLVPEKFPKQRFKLILRCKIHNEEVVQTATSLLNGTILCSGCINDKYQKIFNDELSKRNISIDKMKKLAKEFAEKYTKMHPEHKYDFSETLYINSGIPIKIYCKIHKKYFWSIPSNMLSQNSRCLYCCKEEKGLDETKRLELQNKFINESKKIFGDLYDYSKVYYKDAMTDVEIVCKKCGKSFFKRPGNHTSLKQGCPYCKKEECRAGFRVSFEEFVQEAKKKFGDRFEYSKEHFVNMGTKMTIYCKKHNYYFEQAPKQHLISQCGCPLCSKEEFGRIPIKMSNEMFIERSKEIFGDDTFDYSRLEYINTETPVELYCNIHKVWFKVIPEKHLCRHQGCPECNNAESCLEKEVRLLLERNDIKFEKEKKFKWLKYKSNMRLDFYLPELNIAIECQGPQHFIQAKNIWTDTLEKLKDTQVRDQTKNEQCKEHNIQILYYSTVYLSRRISDNYFLGHIITSKEELLERILEIQNANN